MDNYVDVAERLRILKDLYPQASLQPANINEPFKIIEVANSVYIVYTAACYREPNDPRPGIGIAWEKIPGKGMTAGSELMICESSAWGRAIVAAIQTSTKRVASKQEIQAAQARQSWSVTPTTEAILEEFNKPIEWQADEVENKVLETMQRVKASKPVTSQPAEQSAQTMTIEQIATSLNATVVEDDVQCEHGVMLQISGISKKTNAPYMGYKCPLNIDTCKAKFMRKVGNQWVRNW